MILVDQVFGATGHVSALQECARAVLVFAYGLILVRAAGRRTFAQWSALDVIVAIIVGSSLSRVLTGNSPLIGTMLATAVVMILHWLFARASAMSEALSELIEGPAITLARGGKLNREAIIAQNVSGADLNEALHQAGADEIGKTRALVLEPSGKISVLMKPAAGLTDGLGGLGGSRFKNSSSVDSTTRDC